MSDRDIIYVVVSVALVSLSFLWGHVVGESSYRDSLEEEKKKAEKARDKKRGEDKLDRIEGALVRLENQFSPQINTSTALRSDGGEV